MDKATPCINDIIKAIRERNASAITKLMFNVKDWTLNAGFFTENEIWDYKESIPSRLDNTEERWAEIAKDVISFYNNQGGIIVFGITDNYRVIRTITQIDSKKFTDKLRKYIGDKIWIDYHRLGIQEDQSYIGLALIPPRGPVMARFIEDSPIINKKNIFKRGDSALRDRDSSKIIRSGDVSTYEIRSGIKEFGQIYAYDEPFYRVLSPEYINFIERYDLCNEIKKGLAHERASVVQITGIGGTGKTAIATWSVLHAYEKNQFCFIVSSTAKDRELTQHGIQSITPLFTSYESLLNAILDVIQFPEFKTSIIDQKEKEVLELIKNSNGLLFVDNLETVDDARLIRFLDNLPTGIKAIVTSRLGAVSVSVYPVRLGPLSKEEGVAYIKSLRQMPGLSYIDDLSTDECEGICSSCDGLPLAIRWTLSKSDDAAEAIKQSEELSRSGRMGDELLEFSFRRIFDSLEKDEKTVLQVLSLFQQPQASEVIYVGSGINAVKAQDAISVLMKDALIQRYFDPDKNDYTYNLLPLARAFVYAQVKLAASIEIQIRTRLNAYFDAKDIRDPEERIVIREIRQGKNNAEDTLIDLAKSARRRGDVSAAESLLQQALARNQNNYTAAHLLAEIYRHERNNVTDALRLYEQAASVAPRAGKERALIFREWGMLIRTSGQQDANDQAIEKFVEAVKCNHDDPLSKFALAQAYDRKGAYNLALGLLIPLFCNGSLETRTKAKYLAKECYTKSGDFVNASLL